MQPESTGFVLVRLLKNEMHDIIIVGAGPAGLTAAVYALRAGKSVMLIEKGAFGGQITYSPKVENFPTIKEISGNELAERMVDAAIELGAEFESDTVTRIDDNGSTKTVVCEGGNHEAKTVIISVGVTHRKLGLYHEDELVGSGVSYCAVCDGTFFKDSNVAVAGGGNTALQEAVYLSQYCPKVYVIEVMDNFTGEAALVEKLKATPNVVLMPATKITKLFGDGSLSGIEVESAQGCRRIDIDGLFVAIGLVPDNDSFKGIAKLDDRGYFDSDENCGTSTQGIFIAGDCRKKYVRQLTTACADGSVAALAACRYIDSNK